MTTATPQRVDVRVPRENAGRLRPGPLSITDGRPTTSTVTIRVRRRIPTMTLPVDEQTAHRLERLERRRARIRRYVAPTLLTLGVGGVALDIVAVHRHDIALWTAAFYLFAVILLALMVSELSTSLRVPPHYPIIQRGYVLVRDVDPVAAEAWAAANPDADMELAIRR